MSRSLIMIVGLSLAVSVFICGCSSDGGGGSDPGPDLEISVELDLNQMDLEVSNSQELTATVKDAVNNDLTWYVNDIENGSNILGTITQNSPVTYTAPDYVPLVDEVVIKAVSVEDTTKYDSCRVNITFETLFVDPVNGNDDSGNGCVNRPFKTLNHASFEADSGMTIVALPGVYSAATGEYFPVQPRAVDVTIEGTDWEQCIIRGHDLPGGYHMIVNLMRDRAVFRKFTLEQGPGEPVCAVALKMEAVDVRIDSIRAFERARYAVCRAEHATRPIIENCLFVVDEGELDNRGINLFPNSSDGILRNCTITGFATGLTVTDTSDLLVEGCTIEGNGIGVELYAEGSPGSLNPDFGGGLRGSAGGNVFRDNVDCGLWFDLPHDIYGKYNTWGNSPPIAGVDYCERGDGDLIYE